jgi:hypothetical protein
VALAVAGVGLAAAPSPPPAGRDRRTHDVDRFVRAGAKYVFVGPNTGLAGPPRVVQPPTDHDHHLHVRLR